MSARYAHKSRGTDPSAGNTKVKLGIAAVLATVVLAVGSWWLTRPPVHLNENQYDTTIALYRVCNQRSEAGLEKIESLLATSASQGQPDGSSHQALQAIVADARQGRWQQATETCRRLLDDQVQR